MPGEGRGGQGKKRKTGCTKKRWVIAFQKRPDVLKSFVHKIALPPSPGESVNFEDFLPIFHSFSLFWVIWGGEGKPQKNLGKEFYGHPDFKISEPCSRCSLLCCTFFLALLRSPFFQACSVQRKVFAFGGGGLLAFTRTDPRKGGLGRLGAPKPELQSLAIPQESVWVIFNLSPCKAKITLRGQHSLGMSILCLLRGR